MDELLVAAKQAINRGDCVLTQTGTSVSGFSTHLGWKYWDAKVSKYQFCREVPSTLTYMTTLPQCIAGLAPRVLTADAFVGSNKYICGLVGSVHRQCNWNGTETNAQVCEAHPPFCGMCYNSTLCVELRGLSAHQCAAAVQCQLQNGTFVTLTGADRATLTARCQSLMSCSELCRDPATQALRPCVNAQECTSLAGSCVDDSALWHYTGSARAPGACLLPITADSPCGLTYSQYNNTVMTALPFGCALHTVATPQQCVGMSAPNFVTRWTLPATTEAACAAPGTTCYRAPLVGFDGRMWPTWSASLTLPPLRNGTSACRLCDEGQCLPYCTWMGGRWLGGAVRPLTWTTAAMQPIVGFEASAFVMLDFSSLFATAVQSAYVNFVISVEQCRCVSSPNTAHIHANESNSVFTFCPQIQPPPACTGGFGVRHVAQQQRRRGRQVSDEHTRRLAHCVWLRLQGRELLAARAHLRRRACEAELRSSSRRSLRASVRHIVALRRARHAVRRRAPACASVLVLDTEGEGAARRELLVRQRAWCNCRPSRGRRHTDADSPVRLSRQRAHVLPRTVLYTRARGLHREGRRHGHHKRPRPSQATRAGRRGKRRIHDVVRDGAQDRKRHRLRAGYAHVRVGQRQGSRSLAGRGHLTHRHGNWVRPLRARFTFLYVPHPAASCAVVTLLSVVAVVSLIIRRPRSFFMAMPFYLLILIGAATLIRAFYFASLATNNLPEQSTAQDVALIEIPTFLWFTAVTLIISFWAVLSSKRLYAFDVLRRVAVIFCVTNLIMYAIFIATIVAFAALQGSKQRCQGRLPPTTQRHQQRVLQTLYQAFLAAVALIIGTVFAFVSLRMLPRLNEAASAAGTQQIRSATYVGLLVAASFVAHAIYLLVLAVASPGVPQLALLVLLTEATPAAVLVAQMLVQWFHTPGGAGGQSGASSTYDGSDAQYFQHDNSDI